MIGFIAPIVHRNRVEKKLRQLTAEARTTWMRVPGTSVVHVNQGSESSVVECDRYEIGDILPHEGHTLLARIEHTEAGNIISAAPDLGRDLPLTVGFANAPPVCDHCGKKRTRRDTLLLLVDGRIKQIGRSCVKKYFAVDPQVVIGQVELLTWIFDIAEKNYDDDPSLQGGYFSFGFISTLMYVAAVIESCNNRGFHKADSEIPTRTDAMNLVRHNEMKESSINRAGQVIEWAKNLGDVTDSGYLHNLKIAASLPDVRRNAGILASILVAYDRAHKPANAQPAVDAGHFGVLNQRVECELTIERMTEIDSEFGSKTLYVFKTEQGHNLIWWCTGRRIRTQDGFAANEGHTVKGKVSIKAHNLYKGKCQTVITRCKLEVA